MTTNDIEKAQIFFCCKNGEKLFGVTVDKALLNFIATYVKFIQIDEEKVGTIAASEIIKNQQENSQGLEKINIKRKPSQYEKEIQTNRRNY